MSVVAIGVVGKVFVGVKCEEVGKVRLMEVDFGVMAMKLAGEVAF